MDLFSTWHPGKQDQTTWDCVIHALNFLLGFPYFQERDQFGRVQASSHHKSLEFEQEHKALKGALIWGLNRFAASEKSIFSLIKVLHWTQEDISSALKQKRYITDQLRSMNINYCLVLGFFDYILAQYHHAFCLKDLGYTWVMLDCSRQGAIFSDSEVPEERWDMRSYFKHTSALTVYYPKEDDLVGTSYQTERERLRRLMLNLAHDWEDKRIANANAGHKKKKRNVLCDKQKRKYIRKPEPGQEDP